MGVAAGHEQTFTSPIYGGSTQNLAFLAKLFKRCLSIVGGRRTQEHRDRRRSIDIQ